MNSQRIITLRIMLVLSFVLCLFWNLDSAGMFYNKGLSLGWVWILAAFNVLVTPIWAAVLTDRKNFVYLFGIVILNVLVLKPLFVAIS